MRRKCYQRNERRNPQRIPTPIIPTSQNDTPAKEAAWQKRFTRFKLERRWAIETHFRIRTKDQRLAFLKLNETQDRLYKIVEQQEALGIPVRVIAVKPRKVGLSTGIQALFFHRCITRPLQKAMTVAHDLESTEEMFQMDDLFYNELPEQLRPMKRYGGRQELVFENPDEESRKTRPGLRSQLTIGTAGKIEAGRSKDIHLLHCSESPYWMDPEATELSLLNAVPDLASTMVFKEGTPSGVGTKFHKDYLDAKAGRTAFAPFFEAWWEVAEYRMPLPLNVPREAFEDTLDDTERKHRAAFNLTLEQLAWRRWAIENKCGRDPLKFIQEYAHDDVSCFLVSGRPRFDTLKLHDMLLACTDPVGVGYLRERGSLITIEENQRGFVKIWKPPSLRCRYLIGADVAEGLEHGDYSCGHVYDWDSAELVAEWHGHCFVPGTQILTTRGMMNIEDVQIGDFVWTHRNRWCRVKSVLDRDYSGPVFDITAQGNYETVTVTPEHPFFSARVSLDGHRNTEYVRRDRGGARECRTLKRLTVQGHAQWIKASVLDVIAVPRGRVETFTTPIYLKKVVTGHLDIPVVEGLCHCGCGRPTPLQKRGNVRQGQIKGKPTKYILGHQKPNLTDIIINIGEDLAFVLGYYSSEGNLGYRRGDGNPDRIQFSFGAHERNTHVKDCAMRLRRLGYRPVTRLRGTVCLVFVYDTYLARAVKDLVGTNAHRKQFSAEIMAWPSERLANVLEAHWRGDGYEHQNRGSTIRSITTVSPALARQLRDILVMTGFRPALRKRKQVASFIANNKTISYPRQAYEIRWVVSERVKYRGMETENLVAYHIKKKPRQYSGRVYNLEVDQDNSYSTACYVVHNCEPDDFGKELAMLGKVYNDALIAVESNKDGGTVNTRLRNDGYPHLFYRQETDRRTQRQTARLGWLTTPTSKPNMINALADAIADGAHIPSKETIEEMMTFVYLEPTGLGAQHGCFDDRVIASAIVMEVRKRHSLTSIFPSLR